VTRRRRTRAFTTEGLAERVQVILAFAHPAPPPPPPMELHRATGHPADIVGFSFALFGEWRIAALRLETNPEPRPYLRCHPGGRGTVRVRNRSKHPFARHLGPLSALKRPAAVMETAGSEFKSSPV
jgi:hypothetical protein